MNGKTLVKLAVYGLFLSFALTAFCKGAEEKSDANSEEASAGWPGWRGPYADSIIPQADWDPSALKDGIDPVWTTNVGMGYSSMAVVNGRLYTMGNMNDEDTVYCLDAATGNIVWKYSYPARLGQYPGPRATPLVDEGKVYTLSQKGHLYCFDAGSGRIIWNKHIQDDFVLSSPGWGFAGSPVIAGDRIILNAGKSGLALRKQDGEKIWSSDKLTRGGYATPVLFDHEGEQYAAIFGERALVVVNLETGEELTSYYWMTSSDVNAADPLIIEKRIFISSNYGKGAAMLELKNNKLELLWKNMRIASHFSSHIYLDGYIYGHDSDARRSTGNLVCIDAETSEGKWAQQMGMVSFIAIGGNLVILDGTGNLHVAEATPKAYKEISQAKVLDNISWTPPVFAHGHIYCRDITGDIVSLDMRR